MHDESEKSAMAEIQTALQPFLRKCAIFFIFYNLLFYLFYIESAVCSEYLCFISSLFRSLRHRYFLRKSASLLGWGMTARLCISRLLYMGGNVSYLFSMFSLLFRTNVLIDKLSEEDGSPESLGIYISIYILSVWFDGILLQVNVCCVVIPWVNIIGVV